jgi:CRP-like cAMP-binding protein
MLETTKPRLRGLAAFEGVGEERLARLEACLRERICRPNEVVYRNGDPCDGLYLIASGAILLRTEVRGEPIDRVFDLGAGEIFGEEESVQGAPRGLAARALGETHLWHLPLEPLRELLREHPFVETVLRALAVRRRSSRLRARLAPASRREPRIWVDLPVTVTVDGGERVGARLEDLSPGGACFSSVPGWTTGRQLVLSLGTTGRPNLLHARATVCWHEEGSAGIQFEEQGPEHRRRIEKALRELVRSVE